MVNVVDPRKHKMCCLLHKVVEMVENSVSQPNDKTLSLSDGHINAS